MSDPTQQPPSMVKSVKLVDVAVVVYQDPASGTEHTQLCVVGDRTVLMLDGRGLGYSNRPDPAGVANRRLRDEILTALSREVPKEG